MDRADRGVVPKSYPYSSLQSIGVQGQHNAAITSAIGQIHAFCRARLYAGVGIGNTIM